MLHPLLLDVLHHAENAIHALRQHLLAPFGEDPLRRSSDQFSVIMVPESTDGSTERNAAGSLHLGLLMSYLTAYNISDHGML